MAGRTATKEVPSDMSQLMPQNVEAEEAVLGAILVSVLCVGCVFMFVVSVAEMFK